MMIPITNHLSNYFLKYATHYDQILNLHLTIICKSITINQQNASA